MNTESVFFNPGDAISSSHDFKKARRSAQIIKGQKPTAGKIVIAQNEATGEYAIYYAAAADPKGQAYNIKEEL